MAPSSILRPTVARKILRVGTCLALGHSIAVGRSAVIRLDSNFALPRANPPPGRKAEPVATNALSQLSKGSVTGFAAGLVVSLFSQTLVFVIGLLLAVTQVAARYGIDITNHSDVRQRIQYALSLGGGDRVVFKVSFITTFVLAAFVHL